METTIVILWVGLALLVGVAGNNRNIGFGGAFFLALLLSPLIGLIFVLLSKPKRDIKEEYKFLDISPKTNFKMFNAFADKDENIDLPGSDWDYTFSEQNGKTTVCITIYNESLARMEKMIEMRFKEGFTMSMTNLENLLTTLGKK